MTPENFCYWLQGALEVIEGGTYHSKGLDAFQVKVIKDHLALVFTKVTPPVGDGNPPQQQETKVEGTPPSFDTIKDQLEEFARKFPTPFPGPEYPRPPCRFPPLAPSKGFEKKYCLDASSTPAATAPAPVDVK